MMKTLILTMLIFSLGIVSAQKLEVSTQELPISKQARKFGQYSGSYWDSNGETLQTIYTYREKRKSPRSFDLVNINLEGKITGPETELLELENLVKLDLNLDETISEEDDFENFDQEMVWFKRVDLGWNAIAHDGYLEPISDEYGFVGYRFEKQSKKIELMGNGNQSLMLDFVLADGPIVDKYASKVLLDRDFLGLSSMASYAYVPKGDKVIIGGLMNGRVKIGMDASPDWLTTRYLVGTYDTEKMDWVEQNFIEFDYTMHSLATLKTDDEVAVLLRKDTKGTIENNRVRFNDSEYRGVVMLIFDKNGNLTSQLDLDFGDFNFPPLQGMANIVAPKFDIRKIDDSFVISAVGFGKGSQFESLNVYKITDGKIAFSQKFLAEDLNNFDSPQGEKVKELIRKKEVPVFSEIINAGNELLLMGSISEIADFMIRLDAVTGEPIQIVAAEYWTPKKNATIPLGVRGWSKTKSSRSSDEFFDYPVIVREYGDWYYILYRKMNYGMTPGSTISSSYSTDNGVVKTTYTKSVKIDELFAFGKLFMVNKKTGAITEPLLIDDEILVGAYGLYLAKDGKAFMHGYDGKKYQMTTVSVK